MVRRMGKKQSGGFTLVELTVAIIVLGSITIAMFTLFSALVNSTIIARRQAVALTLATNQMEYLKSLPYDSLAVQGGSIYATTLLPATKTQTLNGVTYTITTSIGYADDAYHGCGSYPTTALKQAYCKNYPAPSSAPSLDTNPADYKILHIVVTDKTGKRLSTLDTQVTARVAESASSTGEFFITVIDGAGNPIPGATVNVVNSTITPAVNASDVTDSNGVAIFYNFPPDSNKDYVVSASKTGFSGLTTIAASGSLQPFYPNQSLIAQQSSSVTLKLYPMTANSLVVESVNTSGAVLANVKVAIKGGYKKYTSTSDTNYYYNNASPDTRPTTDTNGLAAISNLPPADSGYVFCGDNGYGSTSAERCGSYYLASAVPYNGTASLGPVTIPIYESANPPSLPYEYGGTNYIQKVRLILTTSSTFPRVFSMTPAQIDLSDLASSLSSVLVTINGYNLSSASAVFTQGANTYTGTGCSKSTTQLKCSYNFSTITTGALQLSVTNSSGTLTLPTDPLGGLNVLP